MRQKSLPKNPAFPHKDHFFLCNMSSAPASCQDDDEELSTKTLLSVLRDHYELHPDRVLLTWLDKKGREVSSLSYRELWVQSGLVARLLLVEKGLVPGDRVMICYPFGLDFLIGIFGSMRAGLIPCSVYPPAPNRLAADLPVFMKKVDDAGAQHALTTTSFRRALYAASLFSKGFGKLQWIVTDRLTSTSTNTSMTPISTVMVTPTKKSPTKSTSFFRNFRQEEDDDDDEEEEEEEQGEEQEEGNEEDQVKEDVADATAEIEDAKEEKEEEEEEAAPPTTAETQQEEAEPVSSMAEEAPVQEEAELTDEEKELAEIYQEICNDGGLLAIDALKGWNEVVELLQDKLLNEAELQDLWTQTANVQQDSDTLMNQAGFLDFNAKLDDLFEFDEDEEEEDDDDVDEAKEKDVPTPPQQEQQAEQPAMVEGDDLPPGVIFASLVVNNDDLLVGKDDLQRWQELQEMLEEGDLLESELDEMFSANAKDGKLDEEGFVALYEAIDDLFEDDDDEEEIPTNSKVKQALLTVLSQLNRDEERLPCGLESTDQEEKQIVNIVALLEAEDTNQIKQSDGEIEQEDLNGTWELLFTSSAAMKFNKGLSGLGGSVPNGKFGGLKQMLIANK